MASYRRVAYEDRCQIRAFLQVGESIKAIARKLKFDKSTVYREVARNAESQKKYRAGLAQKRADKRRYFCCRPFLISDELEGQVLSQLFCDWSPDQISRRLAQEEVGSVSHQTIYNYIARNGRSLWPYLRRFNRRGASRIRMTVHKREGKVSIDERPVACENRKRIGDWERDCMYGANQKRLLVCVDRKSRLSKITKLTGSRVIDVTRLTNKLLKQTNRKVHTITNDNGPEFRRPDGSIAPVYYCYPRRPQQRGTVENTIGLIRQYIKRRHDLDLFTDQDIKRIEDLLNSRPRKCLDYKTPYEVFYQKTVALVL